MKNNKIFELYTLASISYERHFQGRVKDVSELYPEGWYEKRNYKLKIEILVEAIKQNQLIINTQKYQSTIEGIKELKKNK